MAEINKMVIPISDGQGGYTPTEITFEGSGSGGHTIINESGTSLAQEPNLQFKGCIVTDDATNNRTVVNISNTADDIIVQPNLSVGDCLVASDDTPFRFAYDSTTQKYGYIIQDGGADTFVPFKESEISDKTIFIAGETINFDNPAVTLGSCWSGGGYYPISGYDNTKSGNHYVAYLNNPINMTGKNHIYISGAFVNQHVTQVHIQTSTSFGPNSGRYVWMSGNRVSVDVSDFSGNYYIGFTISSWQSGASMAVIDNIYYD